MPREAPPKPLLVPPVLQGGPLSQLRSDLDPDNNSVGVSSAASQGRKAATHVCSLMCRCDDVGGVMAGDSAAAALRPELVGVLTLTLCSASGVRVPLERGVLLEPGVAACGAHSSAGAFSGLALRPSITLSARRGAATPTALKPGSRRRRARPAAPEPAPL